jgi:hypothetical protein
MRGGRPQQLTVAAAVAAAALAGAGSAAAIPWDAGGAIPPARTPPAERPDPTCAQSYADDRPRGGPALRFGIGPRLAGEAGAQQTTPTVPEDLRKRDAALERLRGRRFLAVRLNRLFQADGRAGVAQFKRMAARFARLGLEVELQVRYHPRDRDNGDIAKWLRYVRSVVRAFGPNRAVTGLQITNEVNITYSKNTSDGFYKRAVEALVRGVIEAKRTSLRLGYGHQEIGFNYAYRSSGAALGTDAAFWRAVGRRGGARLRRATDWIGLDIYPGTFTPGLLLPLPIADYGDAFLEGLAQVRECFMPKAGFTRSTPLRVEETGYPTGPGRPEATQLRATREFVRTAVAYRGTYGISDFRWFGLRDNNSEGPNFQSFFGLLRDDYSPKPAFGEYRRLIARYGRR